MRGTLIKFLKITILVLPYVFVFLASLYQPIDPDLGWHLKYGEYFFQHHQLLRDNTFSTMMPNFHWANESWGTDLITYAVFHYAGFLGLTITAALIVTLTFFFFAQAARLTLIHEVLFFPIIVYLETAMNNSSLRGQQISMLFLGILFYLLSRYKRFSKILYPIPFLFFLWCNIHGEVFLGLALFGLWMALVTLQVIIPAPSCLPFRLVPRSFSEGGSFMRRRVIPARQSASGGKAGIQSRQQFHDIRLPLIIFLLSFLATLINPFGWGIHLVALSHFGNPLLQKISEYIPFPQFSLGWWMQIAALTVLLLGIIYLLLRKKAIQYLQVWGIPLILLLYSFTVRRYAWPAFYLMLPVLPLLKPAWPKLPKIYILQIALSISLISLFFIIKIKPPVDQFSQMSWSTYCNLQTLPCTTQSAEFIRAHNLTRNLFTYYDWGGWLIWNYPEVKPSIDGRMAAWQDTTGYSAVADYDKYELGKKSLDSSPYDIVYIPQDRSPLYMELSDLISQNKWKLAYEDEFAIVAERIKK